MNRSEELLPFNLLEKEEEEMNDNFIGIGNLLGCYDKLDWEWE